MVEADRSFYAAAKPEGVLLPRVVDEMRAKRIQFEFHQLGLQMLVFGGAVVFPLAEGTNIDSFDTKTEIKLLRNAVKQMEAQMHQMAYQTARFNEALEFLSAGRSNNGAALERKMQFCITCKDLRFNVLWLSYQKDPTQFVCFTCGTKDNVKPFQVYRRSGTCPGCPAGSLVFEIPNPSGLGCYMCYNCGHRQSDMSALVVAPSTTHW